MEIDQLLDEYGTCKLDKCACIQPIKRTSPVQFPKWLGRLCPNWQARLPTELIKALEEIKT